jgi:hypothetical protein
MEQLFLFHFGDGAQWQSSQKGFSIETTSYWQTLKTGENLANKKRD